MKIETQSLDLVEEVCRNTERLSLMSHSSFVYEYVDISPIKSWSQYFRLIQPNLCVDIHSNNPLTSNLIDEITLNYTKITHSQDPNGRTDLSKRYRNTVVDFINPTLSCYELWLRRIDRIKNKKLQITTLRNSDTDFFMHLCLSYQEFIQSDFYNEYGFVDIDFDLLTDAVGILNIWKQELLSTLALIETEQEKPLEKVSATAKEEIASIQPIITNSDPTIESNQSLVKLRWNGTNRSLYYLFAQLSLEDVKPGQALIGNSIANLAQFLSANVEGFPSAPTVERELEKMREPQGIEKAKRGRIDLNILKE